MAGHYRLQIHRRIAQSSPMKHLCERQQKLAKLHSFCRHERLSLQGTTAGWGHGVGTAVGGSHLPPSLQLRPIQLFAALSGPGPADCNPYSVASRGKSRLRLLLLSIERRPLLATVLCGTASLAVLFVVLRRKSTATRAISAAEKSSYDLALLAQILSLSSSTLGFLALISHALSPLLSLSPPSSPSGYVCFTPSFCCSLCLFFSSLCGGVLLATSLC